MGGREDYERKMIASVEEENNFIFLWETEEC